MFEPGEARVHAAQNIYGMSRGGGLLPRELAEIAVDKTHETEAAEGDDFSGVFSQQTEVFSEWFAHGPLIQRMPRSCKKKRGIRRIL